GRISLPETAHCRPGTGRWLRFSGARGKVRRISHRKTAVVTERCANPETHTHLNRNLCSPGTCRPGAVPPGGREGDGSGDPETERSALRCAGDCRQGTCASHPATAWAVRYRIGIQPCHHRDRRG